MLTIFFKKNKLLHDDSDIIGSYIVYKRKLDGSGKARMGP